MRILGVRILKSPTHFAIGHLLASLLPGTGKNKIKWVIAGAVLPDLALVVLVAGCWLVATQFATQRLHFEVLVDLVDGYYFANPLFISLHHVLHSPVSLIALMLAWWVFNRADRPSDLRGLWFLSGAMSHSIVDIFSHAKDGVLIFWPLNWHYRFNAGLNQWDMEQGAMVLIVLEALIGLFYVGFLARRYCNDTCCLVARAI